MGIINISKGNKPDVEAIRRAQEHLKEDSLNVLNNSDNEYNYTFEKSNAGMNGGKLKIERGLIDCVIISYLGVFIKLSLLFIFTYAIIYFLDIPFELVIEKEYFTVNEFNKMLIRAGGILLGMLFLICFVVKIAINGSIKKRFRTKYLNKVNIYIYDVFVVILNVILYAFLAFCYFKVIEHINSDFVDFEKAGRLAKDISLNIFGIFKYVIVVIVSIFIALNSMRGIAIVHKRNEFVFNDDL